MDMQFPGHFTMPSLLAAMRECPQAPGISVLDHGDAVWRQFTEILGILRSGGSFPPEWRIPFWMRDPGLEERLMPIGIIREYLVHHDCGKVLTRQVDGDGHQHFPGHSAASESLWLSVGGSSDAARLMGMDMDAHLLRGDGIAEFASRPEAVTLLFAAVAEVHSNAGMFGGFGSDSFKIKAKHIDRRGRQVLAAIAKGPGIPEGSFRL